MRVAILLLAGCLLAPLSAFAGHITLTWDASAGTVDGYTVFYGTSSGNYTAQIDTSQTSVTIQPVINGVRYYFVVRAYTLLGGYSAASNEVSGLPSTQTPLITNPGNKTVKAGALALAIAASDPDGDVLTYSASGLPAGLGINTSTGIITGTVAAGIYSITVTASDGGQQASTTFTLTVRVNHGPTLQSPGDRSSRINDAVSMPLAATDSDGDPLTFTATGLPPGLTIDTASGLVAGTPNTVGVYPVTVGVTDGALPATVTFMWKVAALPPGSFADDPLVAGLHTIRAIHISELRTRIDALRAAHGLGAISWPMLVANVTIVAAADIRQLRTALDEVYQAMNLARPAYADDPLGASGLIRAVHITELRAFVRALE